MKVLSLNVRGLGRPSESHLIKYFLLSSKADIICLQETKLQDIHFSMWKSIGGCYLDTFKFIPTIGTTRGIVMAWDKDQIIGSLIPYGSFSLTLEFTSRVDNLV